MKNLLTLALLATALFTCAAGQGADAPPRPNILWIITEDISPNLGCYGDKFAVTPNLDRLAARSVRYANCFSIAGVCAPSRSGLITGMYPSSLGSQHMRCTTTLPPSITCFPAYLRAAGYYCSNNSKQDCNFATPKDVWDESSGKPDIVKRLLAHAEAARADLGEGNRPGKGVRPVGKMENPTPRLLKP